MPTSSGVNFGILLRILRGRHPFVFVTEKGDVGDEKTFFALARLKDFAIHTAFKRERERIQPQLAFGLPVRGNRRRIFQKGV